VTAQQVRQKIPTRPGVAGSAGRGDPGAGAGSAARAAVGGESSADARDRPASAPDRLVGLAEKNARRPGRADGPDGGGGAVDGGPASLNSARRPARFGGSGPVTGVG